MKKLILNLALIGATTLGFMSCTQDDEVTKSSSNSNSAKLMVFASVDEYENLFAEPEKTDSLVSGLAMRYGTYSENARVSSIQDTLYPEFLQKILNDDYIVQIDQWLFKVDISNSSVLVLETKYIDQYDDLVTSNLNNANILVYSTDDDVLTMLRDGVKSEVARTQGLFCKGANRTRQWGPKYDAGDSAYADVSIGRKLLKVYVANFADYSSFGIYFNLKVGSRPVGYYANVEYQINDTGAGVKCQYNGNFTKNCRTTENRDDTAKEDIFSLESTKNIYVGPANVSKYDLKVRTEYKRKKDGSIYLSVWDSFYSSN